MYIFQSIEMSNAANEVFDSKVLADSEIKQQ